MSRPAYPSDSPEKRRIYKERYSKRHPEGASLHRKNHKLAHPEFYVEKQKRRRKLHPERAYANYAVNRAIRSGKLIRPKACSKCGKICKPHGHHPDYSKPLEVVWLCQVCHLVEHGLPTGALET